MFFVFGGFKINSNEEQLDEHFSSILISQMQYCIFLSTDYNEEQNPFYPSRGIELLFI